jgi:hypothetical protein
MKSTYDVVAIVVVRRSRQAISAGHHLKNGSPNGLSNLRLHPPPHHAIEIEQPARSDMGKDPPDEPNSTSTRRRILAGSFPPRKQANVSESAKSLPVFLLLRQPPRLGGNWLLANA